MTQVIAAYNIKGGVGKTSTAINLASLAAHAGARVLLWDLDPQGASTYLLRVKPRIKGGGRQLVRGKSNPEHLIKGTDQERLELLPADFSYRHMDLALDASKRPTRRLRRVLQPIAADYDYVFLDCAPSISLVSENVFEAADALLVPLIPATLSERTLEQLAHVVDHDGPRVLAFFSMVDGRKRLHREVMERLAGARSDVLSTFVPAASDIERMGVHRAAVADFAPRGRAARAYVALWDEVQERLGTGLDR
jgi:chromosome partitioning protein